MHKKQSNICTNAHTLSRDLRSGRGEGDNWTQWNSRSWQQMQCSWNRQILYKHLGRIGILRLTPCMVFCCCCCCFLFNFLKSLTSFWKVVALVCIPGYPIDGNRWSEKQSINRYHSIKLVNWYRLVSVNRWQEIIKVDDQLASIGKGPRNRRQARYLSDHPPFLGSPRDKIGKRIPIQHKEYTPLNVYSNCPLVRRCFPCLG